MTGRENPPYAQRCAVYEAAVSLATQGLATGSSGNVSQRLDNRLLITASGIPYDRITPEQIIEIDDNGQRRSGNGEPSSEWRMHAVIYAKRPDIAAIVQALGDGRLALIARHGAVAVGATLAEALTSSVKLEEIARLTLLTQQFRSALPDLEVES